MKEFLKELEKESLKYFNKSETSDVVSYYEEIINDRLDNGEVLATVLNDYDIKKIVKEMIPEIVIKRDLDSLKIIRKSSWHLLLTMFSFPILIPLGLLYLLILFVFLCLSLAGLAIFLTGVASIIPYIIEVFGYTTNMGLAVGFLGLGLIGLALLLFLGVYLIKAGYFLIRKSIKWFSNLVLRKRVKHA